MNKDKLALGVRNIALGLNQVADALGVQAVSNTISNVSNTDSNTERWLRLLTMVKDAGGSVTGKEWRAMLTACGYDTRGGGGFYVGANASMRREADNSRVLTDAGKGYLAQFGEVR